MLKLIETMKFNSNHTSLLRSVSLFVVTILFSFVSTAQTIRYYMDEVEFIRQQAECPTELQNVS